MRLLALEAGKSRAMMNGFPTASAYCHMFILSVYIDYTADSAEDPFMSEHSEHVK